MCIYDDSEAIIKRINSFTWLTLSVGEKETLS